MLALPASRRTLITGPWVAGAAGGLAGFLALPAAGPSVSLWVGLAGGVILTFGAGYLLYRSVYGSTHGLVAGALLSAYILTLCVAASASVARMLGRDDIMPWLAAAAALTPLLALFWSARDTLHTLRREGAEGPWPRAALDLRRGRVRGGIESAAESRLLRSRRLWLGAAIVNLPWMWKAWSTGQPAMLALTALMVIVGATWFCLRNSGPAMGRAWYLRQLEHEREQHFVHEHLEQLQEMRRSYWLSRLLMGRA